VTAAHVELYVGEDGDWYFRFVADNGEQITRSSEGYRNRGDAVEAILLAHGIGAPIVEVREADDG